MQSPSTFKKGMQSNTKKRMIYIWEKIKNGNDKKYEINEMNLY
jgi:hypothetical protein